MFFFVQSFVSVSLKVTHLPTKGSRETMGLKSAVGWDLGVLHKLLLLAVVLAIPCGILEVAGLSSFTQGYNNWVGSPLADHWSLFWFLPLLSGVFIVQAFIMSLLSMHGCVFGFILPVLHFITASFFGVLVHFQSLAHEVIQAEDIDCSVYKDEVKNGEKIVDTCNKLLHGDKLMLAGSVLLVLILVRVTFEPCAGVLSCSHSFAFFSSFVLRCCLWSQAFCATKASNLTFKTSILAKP